jgi:hypothetical protein
MSDRRADGARRKTGGLILLSVAWVGVLSLVNQPSTDEGSTSNDSGGSGFAIEYVYLHVPNGATFDALQSGAQDCLATAFSDVGQTVSIKARNLDTANTVWDYEEIDTLYAHYKKDNSCRYWLLSVQGIRRNGVLEDALGLTPMENNPGHDGRNSQPLSILMYDNILRFAGVDPRQRWWASAVVHEMGHQRAALTHPEDFSGDHQGINSNHCVMHLMNDQMTEEQKNGILNDHSFCGKISDFDNGVWSCSRYLIQRGQAP